MMRMWGDYHIWDYSILLVNAPKPKVKVKAAQSCPTLCELVDCGPPGSSVHGFLQARTLEWVDIPFSRGSSWPRAWTSVSSIAGRFFTTWTTREAKCPNKSYLGKTHGFLKWCLHGSKNIHSISSAIAYFKAGLVQIYIFLYVCMFIFVYVYVNLYMYIYVHLYTYIHIYVYICLYICVFVYVNLYRHIYI